MASATTDSRCCGRAAFATSTTSAAVPATGWTKQRPSRCGDNLTTQNRTVLNDPIVQGLSDTDNTWFQARSLINYAERINVPIHISGAYQDEQTGPRGPYHLFEAVDNAPVRGLLMTNGDHGTQQDGEVPRSPTARHSSTTSSATTGSTRVRPQTVCARRAKASKPPTCTQEPIPAKYDATSVITFLENLQGRGRRPRPSS